MPNTAADAGSKPIVLAYSGGLDTSFLVPWVAENTGRAAGLAERLNRLVIGSIGPVCSRALREHGITPSFEADPPKLGPLVASLDQALSAHPRQ